MTDYSEEIWAVMRSYLSVETRRGNPINADGKRINVATIVYISGIDQCVDQLNKLMNSKRG